MKGFALIFGIIILSIFFIQPVHAQGFRSVIDIDQLAENLKKADKRCEKVVKTGDDKMGHTLYCAKMNCGNGVIDTGEECDPGDPQASPLIPPSKDNPTCQEEGFSSGTAVCLPNCHLDLKPCTK